MKRSFAISIFALILCTLFVLSNSSTQASNAEFEAKFAAVGDKKAIGESGKYNFDKAHSAIGFRVRHLGLVDVPGFFRDFTGTIDYNADDVTKSSVVFSAKMTSVDTGVAPRDKHLRSKDFFEVEKFPDMTFTSTKVAKKGKGWMVTGNLTMKGVTKTLTFPINITGFLPGAERSPAKIGVTAETTINRRDFGVNYGDTLPSGIAALSDNVVVWLQIEANKAKAE